MGNTESRHGRRSAQLGEAVVEVLDVVQGDTFGLGIPLPSGCVEGDRQEPGTVGGQEDLDTGTVEDCGENRLVPK
jgi:hypothetical protein